MQAYNELIEKIRNLELEAQQILKEELPEIISRIKKEINLYRIPISALIDKKTKYKSDKIIGKWCGRGRKPKWFKESESAIKQHSQNQNSCESPLHDVASCKE